VTLRILYQSSSQANLSEVLTGHHRRAHPEAPGLPSR